MYKKIVGIFIVILLIGIVLPSYGMIDEPYFTEEKNLLNIIHKKSNDNNEFNQQFYNIVRPKLSDFTYSSPEILIKNELPSYFSWKDYGGYDWTTPVKDQATPKYCGCCWAFCAISILESCIKIDQNNPNLDIDLSEQYILSCLPEAGNCSGGNEDKAFKYIISNSSEGNYYNGIIPEECFPYQADDKIACSEKCDNWVEKIIPIHSYGIISVEGEESNNWNNIKNLIISVGPIGGAMMKNNYFNEWLDTHHDPNAYIPYYNSNGVNHVVMILGWKDDPSIGNGGYWICKNSYGTEQGYDGFFNIEYNSLNILGKNTLYASYVLVSEGLPDLSGSGILSWTNIKSNDTVSGSFIIENVGKYGSLLDWDIIEFPNWGDWIFSSESGEDLKPEDGPVIITVNVTAPSENNQEFSGEIKIVNKDNSSDYSIIPISLSTTKNKLINTSLYLQKFFSRFGFFKKILNQIILN